VEPGNLIICPDWSTGSGGGGASRDKYALKLIVPASFRCILGTVLWGGNSLLRVLWRLEGGGGGGRTLIILRNSVLNLTYRQSVRAVWYLFTKNYDLKTSPKSRCGRNFIDQYNLALKFNWCKLLQIEAHDLTLWQCMIEAICSHNGLL
jgi:hypothetical protein